jgi:cytochrome c-type biogenesis protein CcmH
MTTRTHLYFWRIACLMLLGIFCLPILAQDTPITPDDVNAVAERMYCPVCENVPLDDCGTTTCQQWKQEIADLLAQGKTSDEIINIFVAKYGEKVSGVPLNPLLRLLSFAIPIIGIGLGVLWGGMTFTRWQRNQRESVNSASVSASNGASNDAYRAQLEQDLE